MGLSCSIFSGVMVVFGSCISYLFKEWFRDFFCLKWFVCCVVGLQKFNRGHMDCRELTVDKFGERCRFVQPDQ